MHAAWRKTVLKAGGEMCERATICVGGQLQRAIFCRESKFYAADVRYKIGASSL